MLWCFAFVYINQINWLKQVLHNYSQIQPSMYSKILCERNWVIWVTDNEIIKGCPKNHTKGLKKFIESSLQNTNKCLERHSTVDRLVGRRQVVVAVVRRQTVDFARRQSRQTLYWGVFVYLSAIQTTTSTSVDDCDIAESPRSVATHWWASSRCCRS